MDLMIRMLGLWLASMLLSFTATAQKTSAAQKEINQKMEALSKAIVAKDSLGLDGLLASDVSYGHSNALVQTKAEFINSIMIGEQDYKTNTVSDIKVRLYENTAIVNGLTKVTMIYKGNPLDMDMKILMVWIKQNGVWQLVARQTVKIV